MKIAVCHIIGQVVSEIWLFVLCPADVCLDSTGGRGEVKTISFKAEFDEEVDDFCSVRSVEKR